MLKTILSKFNLFPLDLQALRFRACQLIFGLTSTCLKIEEKDHPASLGMMFGHCVGSTSRCWLFKCNLAQIFS